ncbi:Retinoblastoma- protein 1 [Rhizophlyctis rosea]|uniref:Retinoblastoma- protein 1 n=1 Tax=Rhizophlyctis rosea TaxID=64517 RepID=A0AAD5SE31_9FUNG|nr:Retinoblastoma- protein 1 [Rhizophlyctis rosea]
MPATPITARNLTARKTTVPAVKAEEFVMVQKKLDALLTPESDDVAKCVAPLGSDINKTVITAMNYRLQSTITSLSEMDKSQKATWTLASKLYNLIMENMLKAGQGRTSKKHLVLLISDGQFHRCLLASAFEIVRYAFEIRTVQFEQLRHLLDVRAFELCMIIELILKNEIWLPWIIVKRLTEIEERLLESEIWKDSTFYKFLESQGKEVDESRPPLARPTESAVATFYAEVAVMAEATKGGAPPRQGDKSLQLLCKRISRLANLRLKLLCQDLSLQPGVQEKAWSCIEWALTAESTHRLLCNRHIDVLIMCALYLAARMEGPPRTFSEITKQYRRQPQCLEDTFQHIFVEDGQPKVGLVKFYNIIFLPAIRPFLKQGQSSMENPLPPFAQEGPPISDKGFTSLQHRATHNLWRQNQNQSSTSATPLRLSTMTPTTKKLYAFESPLKARPIE